MEKKGLPNLRQGRRKLEGKIVLSLLGGFWGLGDYPKRFSELKWILNVSDPGLSKALQRLRSEGIIKQDGQGRYYVKPELRASLGNLLHPLYGDFLLERMQVVAESLQRFNLVVSLIVFGSVAQGRANYDSDVDLLIIVEEWDESLEREIHETISRLTVKMGIPIEAIILSMLGLKALLQHELQFLFGLLQGYVFLYDKANVRGSLHTKEEEIKGKYEYYEEIPLWLPRTK